MFTVIRADQAQAEAKADARAQMADIFADGFTQWLGYFSKDRSIIAQAFAHMFVLDQFYLAMSDGQVAAMAACTDGKATSVRLDARLLRKHLGLLKGSLAAFFLKKEFEGLLDNPDGDACSIEFVGTALPFRGQGAASHLLGHIVRHTSYRTYLIEEVADTNTPAMKLYQKLGFQEYKRKALPEKLARKNGIHHLVSLKYVK
ncbi:Acetyltransferase (GNAT) family protein [Paenibacillus sp. UNCCL117]|uniref:GNAT family N-acetyltransferase n=1 Tax=unclassified Paenibacillus TaxID=185978 RepID=UPI000883B0CC|nr:MULTISPECIES: GNAT family N-acetyltransferase [unclassified Paenibacillus]SDC13720.1 Acetyltransferase (GNAT) family protein [Paenibacillus sp. cl123]SFW17136.1 Acetyltransferase (GNAT) family protein [Paenibacillus sp. UNCCL117]